MKLGSKIDVSRFIADVRITQPHLLSFESWQFLLHLMHTQLQLFAIRRGAKSRHVAVLRNQQRPPWP